jgi:hypothetical protein
MVDSDKKANEKDKKVKSKAEPKDVPIEPEVKGSDKIVKSKADSKAKPKVEAKDVQLKSQAKPKAKPVKSKVKPKVPKSKTEPDMKLTKSSDELVDKAPQLKDETKYEHTQLKVDAIDTYFEVTARAKSKRIGKGKRMKNWECPICHEITAWPVKMKSLAKMDPHFFLNFEPDKPEVYGLECQSSDCRDLSFLPKIDEELFTTTKYKERPKKEIFSQPVGKHRHFTIIRYLLEIFILWLAGTYAASYVDEYFILISTMILPVLISFRIAKTQLWWSFRMILLVFASAIMILSSITYHLIQNLTIDQGIDFGIETLYYFIPATIFASLFKDKYASVGLANSRWEPRKLQMLPLYTFEEE